jgi:uncharacterized SAM-binding protein YcdF (DUF218 family)
MSWTSRHRQIRQVWRFGVVVLCIGALGVVLWVGRGRLLRGAAELWIVSDAVSAADAAVVLGGGLDVRPFAAAELYKRGLVKKVLVSQDASGRAVAIGAVRSDTDANREVLLKLGVPASAIATFGTANNSTEDEALALRHWAEHAHPSVLIIPVDIFAARRVRWIFDHEFLGQPVRIEVPSFDTPSFTRTDWWKNQYGIVAFQNEILKYIYYRLKY